MGTPFTVSPPIARHPLAEARHLRGWSQEALAHLLRNHGLGTTRRTVMRWERGVTPDRTAQAGIAVLFHVDAETRARTDWPNWLPVRTLHTINAPWNLPGTIEALANTAERAIMDRRTFVALTGAELLLPVSHWRINPGPFPTTGNQGRQVSETLITEIEKLISIRRTMDDEHGSGGMLDVLHTDLRYVTNLLKNGTYSEKTVKRLYGVTAEIARMAGAAAADSGRESAAQQYYLAALRAANAAGDHSLGVYIVGHLGTQAYWANRPYDATQLLEAATTEAKRKTPEIVQALTWARAGRAHAKAGDHAAARHALTTSSSLMDKTTSGDAPEWAYWFDRSRVAAQTGRALCELGDHEAGQREIVGAIQSWGDRYTRDRATHFSALAVSHLSTKDLDSACDYGTKAVDLLAGKVDSGHARKLLHSFEKELIPFKESASAREFSNYARARLVAA